MFRLVNHGAARRGAEVSVLLHPIFLFSLFLLLLNDHYLKPLYTSWLTGKLSDFAGLLVFAVLLAVVVPRLNRVMAPSITALGFVLWKSPLVSPLIDWCNEVLGIPLVRVVDYTDLLALSVLPLAHYVLARPWPLPPAHRILKPLVFSIGCFACVATSVPVYITSVPSGTLALEGDEVVKLSKEDLFSRLRENGYPPIFAPERLMQPDSLNNRQWVQEHYYVDIVPDEDVIPSSLSDIRRIGFTLDSLRPDRTRVYLLYVTTPRKEYMQDWRAIRWHAKSYARSIRKAIFDDLDEK